MSRTEIALDQPFDLVATLRPLVRGTHDPTVRLRAGSAWLTARRRAGPVTIHLRQTPGLLTAEAWGPGADDLATWLPDLVGLGSGGAASGDLRTAAHPRIADLARRHPGIRIPATRAVLDVLVPAILEQKVTGTEARRAWYGLIRTYGEPAPGPSGSSAGRAGPAAPTGPALRLTPPAATLARLPYYVFHPFGVEQRRADLIRAIARRADWFEAIVDLPLPEAHARLRSVPGIGPWTAAEVAVRALGDVDAVSVGDFHLPNLVAWSLAGEPRGTDDRMLELLAPYAGRRALAMRLLETGGSQAPRYGPRLTPRRIDGI
jgi:3-methyladenine DNA glycosylase/8-oxoguanine DNA glycosylase